LQRKLDHVENKAKATTAEAFIDLAATASSSSGQPYRVQCTDAQAVASATWLKAQLAQMRQRPGPPPSASH
jgi:hypothetical protein